MKELINFLTDWGDISVGVVFVLIPFSAFVALFHHVILGGIYGWDYKLNGFSLFWNQLLYAS